MNIKELKEKIKDLPVPTHSCGEAFKDNGKPFVFNPNSEHYITEKQFDKFLEETFAS